MNKISKPNLCCTLHIIGLSSDHICCLFATALKGKKRLHNCCFWWWWWRLLTTRHQQRDEKNKQKQTKKTGHFILTSEFFSCNLLGEPPQHMFFVFSHPFDVRYGLLYGLLQSQGAGAKTNMEVVFFKLLQLEEWQTAKESDENFFCLISL